MCEAAVLAVEVAGGGHGFACWMSTLTGPVGTDRGCNLLLLLSRNDIHPPVEDGKQAVIKVHARYKMMVL